jgi:ribonuclease HI
MTIEVYIDGLSEPTNPGIGTFGYVIYRDKEKLKSGHGLVGEKVTNNVAEYAALIEALRFLKSAGLDEAIVVKSDSRLLVNQMLGKWKTKRGQYLENYLRAKELAGQIKSINFRWIPREQNEEADILSRIAYYEHARNVKHS